MANRSDPQDKDYWVLDEDAAPVVKRIFDLTIDGVAPSRIARILEADKVLTTKVLYAQRKGKPLPERPYHWIEQSVVGILGRMEYTGCVCNFKTYSKSYKLKKRIPNAKEDMFILPDTQEAIVPQAQWERVQELRKNKQRVTKGERKGLFPGWRSALTAAANSISVPAKLSRDIRTAMFAPITRVGAAPVRRTLYAKMFCVT